jgi:hypothetical protein
MGTHDIHIKQAFLAALERNGVSLKPGEISSEYENQMFRGRLCHLPSGDFIINGPSVHLNVILREWSDITKGPNPVHVSADS